jgi:SAM-dependent methyltransferase
MSTYRAQHKSKEIAFFDAHGTNDEEYDVFTPQANAQLVNAFVRLSGLPRGSRVADLGCGSRLFTELLRREGYESIGLDISPKLVTLGRTKFPGLELLEGDVENLPFDNDSLDGVAAEWVGASFSRSAAAGCRSPPRAKARWSFRRLRSQPHESIHVALSRPRLPIRGLTTHAPAPAGLQFH